MTAFPVVFRKHVEQERLHVVVQRLVVQEKFRKQAQVLAIDLIDIAVHLKDGDVTAAVNLSGGWMLPSAFVLMSLQYSLALGVLQTKFAKKQFGKASVFLWER